MPKQLAFFLFLFMISSFCFAEITFELHPKPHEGYEIKEDKIYFRHGNGGLILEAATPASVVKYYKDRGVDMGNPFVDIGGDMQGATLFIVTLLNRTNGNVTFTPRYVTLKIKTEAFFPMDFTVLMEFTEGLDPRVRKILEKSVFLQPELIGAGKIVTKFMIFPALPKKFDELKLEFDYMFFESKELKPNFYFTRTKLEGN